MEGKNANVYYLPASCVVPSSTPTSLPFSSLLTCSPAASISERAIFGSAARVAISGTAAIVGGVMSVSNPRRIDKQYQPGLILYVKPRIGLEVYIYVTPSHHLGINHFEKGNPKRRYLEGCKRDRRRPVSSWQEFFVYQSKVPRAYWKKRKVGVISYVGCGRISNVIYGHRDSSVRRGYMEWWKRVYQVEYSSL